MTAPDQVHGAAVIGDHAIQFTIYENGFRSLVVDIPDDWFNMDDPAFADALGFPGAKFQATSGGAGGFTFTITPVSA